MPKGHTICLTTPHSRRRAAWLCQNAPHGHIASVAAPRRTGGQNDKMWAMLRDVSMSKPEGRCHTPEVWKAIFMNACGWEVQFVEGLDGLPFPSGFKSSHMTVGQMSDLITYMQEYGDRHGVRWTKKVLA